MQNIILAVIGMIFLTIGSYQISPSVMKYIQAKKADNLIEKEKIIYDAIKRHITLKGTIPASMDELIAAGYLSANAKDNGWGDDISFTIDASIGVITFDSEIPDSYGKSAYLTSWKHTIKPTNASGNQVDKMFVIPTTVLHGNAGGIISGAKVGNTPPTDGSVYWYDTSSGKAVLKMSNGSVWSQVTVASGGGLPPVTSANTVTSTASLPTTGVDEGDIRYVYNADTQSIDTYTYYPSTGWALFGSGGSTTTTTPKVVAQGYRNKWHIQDQLKTTTTTDITGWNVGATLPYTSYTGFNIVTTSRVYYVGGSNGDNLTSNVLMATINSDGTLGTFATTTALPSTLYNPSVVVTKNRVYLIGGHNGSSALTTVLTAPINSDGTLGNWSNAPALPSVKYAPNVVVTKNRVYLLGGHTGSAYVKTVFTAPINADGTLGDWATATDLPDAMGRQYSGAVVVNNKAYVIGGYNGSAYSSSIFSASIDDSGMIGTWSEVSLLPTGAGRYASATIATSNRVFLMGGYDGSAHTKKVFSAPIDSNGNIGTWVQGTSISGTGGLTYVAPMVTKNRVFIIGGHTGSAATNEIYSAPFDGWEINKNEHTY